MEPNIISALSVNEYFILVSCKLYISVYTGIFITDKVLNVVLKVFCRIIPNIIIIYR